MIHKPLSLVGIVLVCLYGVVACDKHEAGVHDDHDHEHGEHDHDDHAHEVEVVGEHAHEEEGHEHDHDHEGIVAGPNGGRVFTGVEPHLELFVTEDRRVRISQVTEELKVEAIGDQTVSAIAGDRSSPTELSFQRNGDVLLSKETLPEGSDFPIVVNIAQADGAKHREKFNLDLADCPTCDYLEYACTCDHGHDH